ncbi:MAG: hypothetical protein J6Y85_03800 [Alphaproteobacteria bacterium]|nr:hypothetical protein [Alphaproteobacteria bacterium]
MCDQVESKPVQKQKSQIDIDVAAKRRHLERMRQRWLRYDSEAHQLRDPTLMELLMLEKLIKEN